MLDENALTYFVGRYVGGRPAPVGAVAKGAFDGELSCAGLAWPSVTRSPAGDYLLYVSEQPCVKPGTAKPWSRVSMWQSKDGRKFKRRALVLAAGRGEEVATAHVVRDGSVYRAGFVVVAGGKSGPGYAESSDGIRFERVAGTRAPVGQLDAVVKDGPTW